MDYLQIEVVKINPTRNKDIMVPTIHGLSKHNIYQPIHQRFGHVIIYRLVHISNKRTIKDQITNLPDL